MSIASLAATRARQENAVAEERPRPPRVPDAKNAQQRLLGELVQFIPAESLAAAVAVLGAATADSRVWVRAVLLGIVALLVPLWVEIHYLHRTTSSKARREVPLFEMFTSIVAYAAWTTAIPATPWSEISGFTTRWGVLASLVTAALLVPVSELHDELKKRPHRRR